MNTIIFSVNANPAKPSPIELFRAGKRVEKEVVDTNISAVLRYLKVITMQNAALKLLYLLDSPSKGRCLHQIAPSCHNNLKNNFSPTCNLHPNKST